MDYTERFPAGIRTFNYSSDMTFTGAVGAICMFPLRAIIRVCVALRIHPNLLTFVGVLINSWAAYKLARGHFISAGFIMIVANIFDFIDGKVALETGLMSKFGGFWDSVIDRFSDIALFIGLIYLYADMRRTDYVMVASFAMMFALMTSYTRARAESLIAKCKVGFMERPERIVLFMIGAFTNRMAGVLWVILVLSVFSVADRVILTYRVLERKTERPSIVDRSPLPARMLWNAFFWTFERATWQYDVMVIAILAFVWLVPPDWTRDPMAHGQGPLGWLIAHLS
jgi:phosphatidylglycerophosphate synthase